MTKRRLGWLLVAVGLAGAVAAAGVDLVRAGRDTTFGPAQRAALIGAVFVAAFGATLIPLGGRQSPLAPRLSHSQSPNANPPPPLPAIARFLYLLALALFVAYLVIYINYAVALFRFSFDYDQGEGFELNDSILFARGEWPYRDNEVYPFYASNYPPLFHLMAVPLIWLFGPAYWTGRLLSFLATLVAATAIGYAVWRETHNRSISILSGLAFLASNYVYHIGPLFRQHMTMVMFETLAIVSLSMWSTDVKRIDGFRAEQHSSVYLIRYPLTTLLLLLLAGYTKQLAVATAAAALGFLFICGPKRAAIAGLGLAAVASAIFLAINRATGGQWWINIILANVNEYRAAQAVELYRQWFSLHFALVTLAAGWLIYEIYWSRLSPYSIWFAFAAAAAALSGKWGAGESYFTTAVAAACVCSGLALGRLPDASANWRPGRAAALAVIIPLTYLAQGARLLHLPTTGPAFGPPARALGLPADSAYYDSQGYTQLGRPPDAADIAAGEQILAFVRAAPGPVLTEEAAFPIHAGKDVVTNPTQLLNLYKNGLYDPTSLMNMIENKEFGVIVLRAQFYPPPVLGAIGQAYEPSADVRMNGFTYRILKPR